MQYRNPFTPTFGIVPPHLAGRKNILTQMSDAFNQGPGNPNLSSFLVGARGCGKTALLSCIAQEAGRSGWVSVTVVAAEGMLDDIIQRTFEAASEFLSPRPEKRLTAIEIAQLLGIEWAIEPREQENWRTRMNAILNELGSHGVGLAICVDEVDATVEEMVRLAATYQLFVTEGKRVALIMAGLPKHTTDLMDNESVSFLRRARQWHLGAVSDAEVARAFRASVEDAGKTIDDDALSLAVETIEGYPYMMQLVGYCAWESSREARTIRREHVRQGIDQAASEFRVGVLDASFRDMSKGDRAFAKAMLECAGDCTLAQVARAMGKGTNYASTYKTRLLQRGIIAERADGSLGFGIPLLSGYLEGRLGVAFKGEGGR